VAVIPLFLLQTVPIKEEHGGDSTVRRLGCTACTKGLHLYFINKVMSLLFIFSPAEGTFTSIHGEVPS